MTANTERLCLLLAGSGMSELEILETLHWLRGLDAIEIEDLVALAVQLRHTSQAKARRNILHGSDSPVRAGRGTTPKNVVNRVERLLLVEAQLSSAAAAELLAELIEREAGVRPRPLGKSSFASWIARLAKETSPSRVVHYATAIRNQFVHGRSSDWPLLDGEHPRQ